MAGLTVEIRAINAVRCAGRGCRVVDVETPGFDDEDGGAGDEARTLGGRNAGVRT
jgi:hypothetical protein